MTQLLTSRHNPLVQRAKRIAADAATARREGLDWLDGDHLVLAAIQAGWTVMQVFAVSDTRAMDRPPASDHGPTAALVAAQAHTFEALSWVTAGVMRAISPLDSPPPLGALVRRPVPSTVDGHAPTIVLDRLQDPGNVGSVLRSAAALGFKQVLSLRGTAGLWSSKVLRSAMGAHMAMQVHEGVEPAQIRALGVPRIGTSSHATNVLGQTLLPWPCAWIFGHEGQGVAPELLAMCDHVVRIGQPGGQESLNVAAAAAICMHASSLRQSGLTVEQP
jgi:RNA methyltransferase, TrmH family